MRRSGWKPRRGQACDEEGVVQEHVDQPHRRIGLDGHQKRNGAQSTGYGSGRFQGQWPRSSCAYVRSSGHKRPAGVGRMHRVANITASSVFKMFDHVELLRHDPQTMKQRNQPRAALINDAELARPMARRAGSVRQSRISVGRNRRGPRPNPPSVPSSLYGCVVKGAPIRQLIPWLPRWRVEPDDARVANSTEFPTNPWMQVFSLSHGDMGNVGLDELHI